MLAGERDGSGNISSTNNSKLSVCERRELLRVSALT